MKFPTYDCGGDWQRLEPQKRDYIAEWLTTIGVDPNLVSALQVADECGREYKLRWFVPEIRDGKPRAQVILSLTGHEEIWSENITLSLLPHAEPVVLWPIGTEMQHDLDAQDRVHDVLSQLRTLADEWA